MDTNLPINYQDIVLVGKVITLSIEVHAIKYLDPLVIDNAMALNTILSQQLSLVVRDICQC